MRSFSRVLSLAVLLAFGFSAFALTLEGTFTGATYYVSKTGSNGDAKSWATAKTNIQDAVNLCVDGDTVIVDDGEYSETTNYTVSGQGDVPTVVIIKKRIHLVSRNGKEKTHIVGKWSDDGKGAGAGAHRGIYVTSAAANTLIENFTIRDCATAGDSSGVNNHFANGGGVAANATAFLVGCTVDNCRAGQGGALGYNVRPINCVISRCQANGVIQVGYRTTNAGYNTIFISCGDGGSGHCLFSNVQTETAINCTFVNCKSPAGIQNTTSNSTYLYNCAFLDSASESHARTFPKNCVTTQSATTDRVVATKDANKNKTGASKYQYLSPAVEDWRVVAGAVVIDAGDASFISGASGWIPTEYAAVDFYGKPRAVGAAVDAGAIEAQDDGVTSMTGKLSFNQGATVTSNGSAVTIDGAGLGLWLAYESFPGQLRIVPKLAAGKAFYGYVLSGCWNSYEGDSNGGFRYPDRNADGGIWLTPPPAGQILTFEQKIVNKAWHVGPTGDFATIQAAVDAAANWDLILVAPGRYTATGDDPVVSVGKAVAIRSENGPESTVIDGEGERQCVDVTTKTSNTQLQGFTLTGGFSNSNGAAYRSSPLSLSNNDTVIDGIRPQLADCIVSNNVASYGAGAVGGWIQRCLFTDNRQTGTADRGAAVRNSLVTGSVIRDNPHGNIAAAAYCRIYNTTFAESDASTLTKTTYRPFDRNTTVINCAACGSYVDNCNTAITPPAGNVRETGTGTSEPWLTTYRAGEVFADAAKGDFRLLAGCAATTKGSATAADVFRFQTGDIGGNAIRYVNGTPLPGAYQNLAAAVKVVLSQQLEVKPSRLVLVTPGEPVTITVTPDEAHPIFGWVVNGNTNLTTEASVTFTPSADTALVTVAPLVNSTFFVDATNGDDTKNGFTAATAKKTLAAVLAPTLSGDTVYAAAGDYDEKTQTYEAMIGDLKNASYVPSRAVVPAGVSLVSVAGKEVTFITGAHDSDSEPKGPNAVRCVTMLGGARLVGFTLRHGATAATTGSERNDNVGGGVLAPWPVDDDVKASALIEDCVIRDCAARTGGGVYGGILHKCRISGTRSTSGGNCCEHSRIDQTVLLCSANQTNVRLPHGIYSSTLIVGSNSFGSNVELESYNKAYPIENSVLITPNLSNDCTLKNVRNVLWYSGENKTGFGRTTFDGTTCSGIVTIEAGSVTKALEMAGLDAEGHPISRTALSVDQGDASMLPNLLDGTTDLAGAPRVSNANAVDLGAYEYDWRVDYAAALGKRLQVTACDSAVELIEGQVHLPAGATLEVTSSAWRAGGELQLGVGSVQGSLNVYQNESSTPNLTATAAGEYKLTVADGVGPRLRFVADADGSTDLSELRRISGMMVIVR